MALKMLSYRDALTEIRKAKFSPVYILMGEEPYYLDLIVKELEKRVVAETDRDFNTFIYYGADARLDVVVASAQQYPMMSERQLVILKEAQAMDKAKTSLEKLEGYVSHPTKTTVFALVFKGDNLNATSKLMKAASASGAVVVKSPKVPDWNLDRVAKDYCQSRGYTIEPKAAAMLAEFIGNDLGTLFGEIEKLIITLPEGNKSLTAELIERNVGISKDYNNFELQRAIAHKDYAKAMRIATFFAANPKKNPIAMTNALLFGYFSRLAIAAMSRDKSQSALTSLLGLKNPKALDEIYTSLRLYSPDAILRAISAIRDADAKSKGIGSMQKEHEILKELLFNIMML